MWRKKYPNSLSSSYDVPLLNLNSSDQNDDKPQSDKKSQQEINISDLPAIFANDDADRLEIFFMQSKPNLDKVKGYMLSAVKKNNSSIITYMHNYACQNSLMGNDQLISVSVSIRESTNPLKIAILKNQSTSVQALCSLGYLTQETYDLGLQKDRPAKIQSIISAYGDGNFERVKLSKCCPIL